VEALKLSYFLKVDCSSCVESYLTGFDETRLHLVSWMPKTAPRAIVMFIHGSGDHVLRYDHWAHFFNEELIGFIGMDIRGHGKSEGKRGHGSLFQILKDIGVLVDYTGKAYPEIPQILYGHSMGANLAMRYVVTNKSTISGLISTSPWLRLVKAPSSMRQSACKLISRLAPAIPLSNGIKSRYLTENEYLVRTYHNDPLVHDHISAQLFSDVLETGVYLLQNRHRFNIPLLIMHGTRDKIASYRASAEFARYTSRNTCFKPWEGGYHELHNDLDKEKVFTTIGDWIDQLLLNRR
jgi:acylglycerol lipase